VLLPNGSQLDCTDSDGDGYFLQTGCGTPVDCNDDNNNIFPGAIEIPNNGIDEDCNGSDLKEDDLNYADLIISIKVTPEPVPVYPNTFNVTVKTSESVQRVYLKKWDDQEELGIDFSEIADDEWVIRENSVPGHRAGEKTSWTIVAMDSDGSMDIQSVDFQVRSTQENESPVITEAAVKPNEVHATQRNILVECTVSAPNGLEDINKVFFNAEWPDGTTDGWDLMDNGGGNFSTKIGALTADLYPYEMPIEITAKDSQGNTDHEELILFVHDPYWP